ncbi:glutamine synthetase family protein [Shewanella sp. C32]|uniref:Glutamine synthetase family protein n=1 Tax=Shewanella electrica TaxID=515560 RepID=A0ABT2FIE4_9GAMM|nr:glutamine synthetase family protein [Shewanella electrica]MCH1924204.1 glutamine synthetase family protein [Shewanella electrica]MCS4556107.1 glutamine synthetase family protein [Shewanella electrica]
MSDAPVFSGFIEEFGLWTDEQREAAKKIAAMAESGELKTFRVSVPDAQSKLRSKTLLPGAFKSALRDGVEFTSAYFSFDSAEGIAFNPFSKEGGLGLDVMHGFSNAILVPDPLTFRVLPWAPTVGWVLCDIYLRDGTPVPFDARYQLKSAISRLKNLGFELVTGLEVEFYITRVTDQNLGEQHMGGLGVPPAPPSVEALWRGFSYMSEDQQDKISEITDILAENCLALGLPLRTMEDEMGPGQLEFTFDVQDPLEAADSMVLFRSMVKQVMARMGLHATFMTKPIFSSFVASGWHLHQSLSAPGVRNAFVAAPDSEEVLSPTGLSYVAGLLEHAVEASVFTNPTVNGYRRRKPNSLAPDRSTWGYDNRAAMVRVQGRPRHMSGHIENRIGEPTANPYLYIASQILSGCDGLERKLHPGPMESNPYEATHRPKLPTNLMEATEALDKSEFFRSAMGDNFINWLVAMKKCEINRFLSAEPYWEQNPDVVTQWEHHEYFTRY